MSKLRNIINYFSIYITVYKLLIYIYIYIKYIRKKKQVQWKKSALQTLFSKWHFAISSSLKSPVASGRQIRGSNRNAGTVQSCVDEGG